MPPGQLDLFDGGAAAAPAFPAGLDYRTQVLSAAEECALAARLEALPFRPFEFQGFLGNRRTVSFGWRYVFDGSGLEAADPMPGWLEPLRAAAADAAGLEAEAFEHALVTEYAPGAGIGWHRDRSVFGEVAGISLLAPARLRFRRKVEEKWVRAALVAEPRSLYLLRGEARAEWEHSIAPMEALRYSITLRTLRAQGPAARTGRPAAGPEDQE